MRMGVLVSLNRNKKLKFLSCQCLLMFEMDISKLVDKSIKNTLYYYFWLGGYFLSFLGKKSMKIKIMSKKSSNFKSTRTTYQKIILVKFILSSPPSLHSIDPINNFNLL